MVAFVPVQEMSAAQGQASVAMAQTNFATVFAKDVVVRVEYRSWAASSAEESCLCIFGELVVAFAVVYIAEAGSDLDPARKDYTRVLPLRPRSAVVSDCP